MKFEFVARAFEEYSIYMALDKYFVPHMDKYSPAT